MFEIELFWHLNCILMLKWIVWNRTVLTFNSVYCLMGWGCGVHQLLLCWGVPPGAGQCPGCNTVSSLMVRFQWCWSFGGVQSTSSLTLLLVPSCPEWLHLMGSYLGQVELNCMFMLNSISIQFVMELFWHLTVCKQRLC